MALIKGYQDALDSFGSTFMDKYELPSGLTEQWFKDAISELELETEATGYDEDTDEFPADFPQYKIKAIGLMMKLYYCERELSRINKLNNIISKDLSFNGTGESKRSARDELEIERNRVVDMLAKLKTPSYA